MEILLWAEPPKTCSASAAGMARLPSRTNCSCVSSAVVMPPSAVPKLTPTSVRGFSGDKFRPGVVERLLGQDERELRVAVDPLELVGREMFGGIEVVDLAGALGVVIARCRSG